MLKRIVRFLGIAQCLQQESRRKKELLPISISLSELSLEQKDFNVRIVHAGGLVELYQETIPASKVMERYPGMCLTRPEVFKRPDNSLLMPDETLLPGQKFYLIPYTTVQKLKRKHQEKSNPKVAVDKASGGKEMTEKQCNCSEESICSAKDFFVAREKWSRCVSRKCGREINKPFIPPIKKPRLWHGLEWQPSLPSVTEVSP